MKNLRTIAMLFAAFVIASCQQHNEKKQDTTTTLTPFFLPALNLKDGKMGSNLTYVDGSAEQLRSRFINPVFNAVKNDTTLAVYNAFSLYKILDEYEQLTPQQLQNIFVRIDTMYVEQPVPPYALQMKVVHDTLQAESIAQFRPLESWQLDEQFRISKKVQNLTLMIENIDPTTGEIRGLTPAFLLQQKTQSPGEKIATIRYNQNISSQGPPNLWFRENLEYSARQRFLYPLLKKALNGELNVYAQPDAATQQMTKEDVGKNLTTIDTVYVDNPEPPYELRKEVREFMPEYTDISAIEFVEELNYAEDGSLSINVLWYAPVVTESDPITGLPKKGTEKTLFWVKCF